MYTRSIKYTDFNGVEREEDFYFNLTKAECIELEHSIDGGLTELLTRITKTVDVKEIMRMFKMFIVKSYGVKSPDGKRFMKNSEVTDAFIESEAYSELFVELYQDPDKFAAFVNGIIPKVDMNPNAPALAPVE